MPKRRRAPRATVAAVAVLLASAACAGDGDDADADAATPPTQVEEVEQVPTPVQELVVDAEEYTFDIRPDPSTGVRPGWTELRFRNLGDEAHQVMFARLKDGVDMAELAEAGAGDSSGAAAIEFVDMLGGVSYIGPGNDITAMVDLPEGTVLAMCYVPTHGGIAHALLGMSTTLEVSAEAPTPTTTTEGGEEPRPNVMGTIELSADGYVIPRTLRPGWYHVENTDRGENGEGLHELSLLHLDRAVDDAEVDEIVGDLAANRTPDVTVDAVGGLGAISAGFDGYVHLDLAEGTYLAVDFMPDPGDPRPHMLDGYHTTFRWPPPSPDGD